MESIERDQSVGFGTSSLMGVGDSSARQALLQTAFDAGVRHFDTAQSYGLGKAEVELGRFIARHPGEVTITTKYGYAPAPMPIWLGERIVDKLAQKAPAGPRAKIQNALRRRNESRYEHFSPMEVMSGLNKSLKNLGVEKIDYFLLHEVKGADAVTADLMSDLLRARSEGKIGEIGLSGAVSAINAVSKKLPEFGHLVQFENSVANRQVEALVNKSAQMFTYRALHESFFAWSKAIAEDAARRRSLEEKLGFSLETEDARAVSWLRFARTDMAGVTILFSSRSAKHIRSNVNAFNEGPLTPSQASILIQDFQTRSATS